MPRQAMHAARWLRAKSDAVRIRSTLDRGAQSLVEKVVALRGEELRYRAIKNQAVVVARDGKPEAVLTRSDLLEYLAHRR